MKKEEQQVKGIIFDLDGTLYSLKGFNTRIAWRSLNHLFLLVRMLRVRNSLRGVDFQNKEIFYTRFFQDLSVAAKKKLSVLQDWYFDSFYPTFINLLRDKYYLRPVMNTFLEKLKTSGIKTAILSDYACVGERLEALGGIPEYFDILASNEEYGVLKPSGRPLQKITEAFGIRPEEALVIGDRESTDGKSALLAGVPFINITDTISFNSFYERIMNL